jgi:hypothetical protein
MSGLVLLAAMLAMPYLALWIWLDPSKPQKYWFPFTMRETGSARDPAAERRWKRDVQIGKAERPVKPRRSRRAWRRRA